MKELITFRDIEEYTLSSLRQDKPSCFNRNVRVERYKVTVEKVVEPKEVIQDRILELWKHSNNYHDAEPLKVYAKKYDVDLNDTRRGCSL